MKPGREVTEMIIIAHQLCYSNEVIKLLKEANNDVNLATRIMRDARNGKYDK